MTAQSAASTVEEATAGQVQHAVPAGQPNRVHELAARLFEAYEVVGGQIYLAGCTLDDVPVVRFRSARKSRESRDFIFSPQRNFYHPVDSELHALLGLDELCDTEVPATVSPAGIRRLITAARGVAGPAGCEEQVSVIWCKYARGKLQFTIGETVAEQAFSGWARGLEPPPFHCKVTGVDSKRVAVTSDCRIIAAEQLASCTLTGQRLPRCELVRCSVTGQLVGGKSAARCPVVRKPLLPAELVSCPMCRQRVSPQALSGKRCLVCRHLHEVRLDDDRLLQVFAKFPSLATWSGLRFGESETVYVLAASRLLERRLIVLDKILGVLQHAACGRRFSRNWKPLEEHQFVASL